MEGSALRLSAGFGSSAHFAGLNIGLDVFVDLRPPVVPKDERLGLFNAGVSCRDMVVKYHDDFSL